MYIRILRLSLPFFIVCIVSGCSFQRANTLLNLPERHIELIDTPFFPQEAYQCGPAALAMLLAESDVNITPDRLVPEIYIPERKGSLQVEIIGAVRRYNRIPYRVKPDVGSVIAELSAGRPVLVLQNLRLKVWPAYHYAVVVGIQPNGSVVLRSGISERLVISMDEFRSTWNKAGNWGLIALQGDELPADGDIRRYLHAIADVEATGNAALAEQGYTSVLKKNSSEATAQFGLANAMYAQNRYTSAATLYASLLRQEPFRAEVANNLAESLAALHCYSQAIAVLDEFLKPDRQQPGMTEYLFRTREGIMEKLKKAENNNKLCSDSLDVSDLLEM